MKIRGQHTVKYQCLGCGTLLGIQVSSRIKHDDKALKVALEDKCPNCGRKLNRKSVRLGELVALPISK